MFIGIIKTFSGGRAPPFPPRSSSTVILSLAHLFSATRVSFLIHRFARVYEFELIRCLRRHMPEWNRGRGRDARRPNICRFGTSDELILFLAGCCPFQWRRCLLNHRTETRYIKLFKNSTTASVVAQKYTVFFVLVLSS